MSDIFKDKLWAVTGRLDHFSRKEVAQALRERGASFQTTVTAKTDVLVSADYDPNNAKRLSSKEKKARSQGTPILNEPQLIALFEGQTMADVEALAAGADRPDLTTRDALEGFRDLVYGELTPERWESICALVDQCRPEDMPLVFDYLDGNLADAEPPVVFRPPFSSNYWNEVVFREHKTLPKHWLYEALRGEDTPKLQLARDANLEREKINSAKGGKFLSCQHLGRLRTLKLANNPTPKKFWVQLTKAAQLKDLTYLHIGKNTFDRRTAAAFSQAAFAPTLTHLRLSELTLQEGATEAFFAPDMWPALTGLHIINLKTTGEDFYETLSKATAMTQLAHLSTRSAEGSPEGLAHFISAPHLANLKVLSLLSQTHQAPLYEALARATHLRGLNHLSLTQGHSLQGFEAVPDMLRAPHFANLDSLVIPIDPEGLAALKDATHLDKIVQLRLELRNCRPEDAEALLSATHLNTVETLGLSGGVPVGFVGRLLRSNAMPALKHIENFNTLARIGDADLMDIAGATHRNGLETLSFGILKNATEGAVRAALDAPHMPSTQGLAYNLRLWLKERDL